MKNKLIRSIFVFLIIMIISSTSSILVYAAENNSIEVIKAQDILRDIASQGAKVMALKKCIPSDVKPSNLPNKSSWWVGLSDGGTATNRSDIFYRPAGSKQVGLWIEKEVTGSADDGKIYCDENSEADKSGLIQVMAKMFDTNWTGILCNLNDKDLPGLINLGVKEGGTMYKKSNDCQRFGAEGGEYGMYFDKDKAGFGRTFYLDSNNADTYYNDGEDYIIELYYNWRRKHKYTNYADKWSELNADSMKGYVKYYTARQDFFLECGKKTVPASEAGRSEVYKHEVIDGKGIKKIEYYEDQHLKSDEDTLWGEDEATCDNLANRINSNVEDWRDKMKDIYKKECNGSDEVKKAWKFSYAQAGLITGSDPNSTKPSVVTPSGDVFNLLDNTLLKSNYESGYYNKDGYWFNFEKTTNDSGETEYKVREFSEDDKKAAQKVIDDYNKYKSAGTYFEDQGEGEGQGFTCHVPDNYTYSEVDSDDDSSDVPGEVEDTCQNAGGAGSLGWIVCPILDWMQEASENIYTDYVEPNLQLETGLFENDNGTSQAWSTFQGFANVCFIILFLTIIFSQLTGVGIDNYGIKKLLPKLIVVAILVNLSYLICVICADLSNILGNALKTMFDNFAVGGSVTVGKTTFGDGAGATAITAVVLVAAVFALGVAVWHNPAILLTLLVGALGVLIAIFFLFILLAARKAAIVVLTAISPLAFVCYMLPNTKKLFDRWLKFWEAMLLLYPICGLLIGGGDFVSRLMLVVLSSGKDNTNGDFFGYFTAMIIGIIPIFFIPTVLKSAFAAFGSIGSKIAGFGDRMRSGATRGIRNSERFKNAQERGQARQKRLAAQRRAGVYIDKEGNVQERRRPSAQLRRRLAGTRAGKALGMDRTIGQNTTAFLQQESARRDDIESMDLDSANATFAGVAAKAKAQRISDQETLIANGKIQLGEDTEIQGKNGQKIKFNAGTAINANDVDSLAALHASMLRRASAAKAAGNDAEYATAMDRVKAAQNLLSKTDGGRGHVQSNLEAAVAGGQTGGLSEAAGHLLDNHGDKYKSVNRGAHAMISDLATKSINDVQTKLTSGEYDRAGVNKYTEESLAGADEAALQKLVGSMGSMSQAERDTIAETAYKALNNSNIHTQPAVEQQLKALSAGYTPPAAPAPRMVGHAAYEDKNGNVLQLREMDNGKFLDDSGVEVDISHFKKK